MRSLLSQKCVELFDREPRLPQDALGGASFKVLSGVDGYGDLAGWVRVMDETTMAAARPCHRKTRALERTDNLPSLERR